MDKESRHSSRPAKGAEKRCKQLHPELIDILSVVLCMAEHGGAAYGLNKLAALTLPVLRRTGTSCPASCSLKLREEAFIRSHAYRNFVFRYGPGYELAIK